MLENWNIIAKKNLAVTAVSINAAEMKTEH